VIDSFLLLCVDASTRRPSWSSVLRKTRSPMDVGHAFGELDSW